MCPKYTVHSYSVFFEGSNGAWGAIIIPIGFLLMIIGRKFLKITIAFVNGAVFIFTLMLVFSSTFMDGTKAWVTVLTLSLTALTALFVSISSAYFIRFGAAVVCATAGFLFGVLLNVAWLYMYNSIILSYSIMGVSGFIVAGLMFIKFNQTLIISTSFIGSYMFFRGIAVFVGYFSDEIVLLGKMKRN